MAVSNFSDVFRELFNMGIMDSLLPFLLVFTIIFAVLQRTRIIGEGHKNFNVIIAMIMAATVVVPHIISPSPNDPVNIINSALPSVSIVVVAIIMFLLVIGVFGANFDIAGTSIATWVALLSAGIILFIFGSSAGWWSGFPPQLSFLNDPDTQALLIIILVFAVVIWLITREEKTTRVGGDFGGFLSGLRDTIKKP